MRITSKGQVTIPIEIRRQAGLPRTRKWSSKSGAARSRSKKPAGQKAAGSG